MADQVDSTSTQVAIQTSPHEQPAASGLVRRFLSLVRFSHTVFALPFALLAAWLAFLQGGLSLSGIALVARGLGVVACMVFARSAAMAFNRLVDADIDADNPRTADRHLPAGTLSRWQVVAFLCLNILAFYASCLLFLPNWLPIALATPVLAWICGYSYAKRFTAGAHLWLGVALALSPICAWIAIRGEAVIANPADLLPAVVWAAAITFWVAGFDIIYACQDADFDRETGLHSIPSWLGIAGALRVAAVLHGVMLLVLAALPLLFPHLSLGIIYAVALAVVAALVVSQHWMVRPDDLRRVGIAFFNINALISFGLSAATALDASF